MLDWKSYEELTKDIYEKIGQDHGVKIIGHGNNCKYKGKSGVEHQIDVLASHSDGFHEYITDIECKYWDQHINKDIVMKVDAIVKDCNFSKGIVVSKLGFTEDAILYAKSVGIGLVELRSLTDEDWSNRIKTIKNTITIEGPVFMGLKVDAMRPDIKEITSETSEINSQKTFIHYPDGKVVSIYDFIVNGFMKELETCEKNKEIRKSYLFPVGTKMVYEKAPIDYILKRLTAVGIFHSFSTTSTISGTDHILYIMKFVFEDKTFTIDSDMQINERN